MQRPERRRRGCDKSSCNQVLIGIKRRGSKDDTVKESQAEVKNVEALSVEHKRDEVIPVEPNNYNSTKTERPTLARVDNVKSEDYAGDVMPSWHYAAMNTSSQMNKAIPLLLDMRDDLNT